MGAMGNKLAYVFFSLFILFSINGCHWGGDMTHLDPLPPIDYILVEKSKRTIRVYHKNEELRCYNISLGKNPVGHKKCEGDCRTPEGVYEISHKKDPYKYYKALDLSYPNSEDRKAAQKRGVSPGGGVQIHGYEPKYNWVSQQHPLLDATRGCILLTNPEMEQIFNATAVGTKIEIRP